MSAEKSGFECSNAIHDLNALSFIKLYMGDEEIKKKFNATDSGKIDFSFYFSDISVM